MRQESSREDLPLLQILRLIKSTLHALHHETDEGSNLSSWFQTGIIIFMISDGYLPNLFHKTSNRVISSTSDKLLSFHRSDTPGLESWSRWSGHASSANLITFPHSRRNYKFKTPVFSTRFQREQFSRSCLPLSAKDPTLVLLSYTPPLSNFFRCLSSNCHPAHSSHLCITVTSVKYKGIFEVTGTGTLVFISCTHCSLNTTGWSFQLQTRGVCSKWILQRWHQPKPNHLRTCLYEVGCARLFLQLYKCS